MTRLPGLRFGRETLSVDDWPFALERLEPQEPPPPQEARSEPAAEAAAILAREVGRGRIAVAVPDRTRPFPRRAVLAPLLDLLRGAGIGPDRVDLVVARGLHGGDAPPDLDGLPAAVHLHDAAATDLVDLGRAGDLPVRLSRPWASASARLSLGTAGFHYLAGFGGGRKTIAPGLAGGGTIAAIHMAALDAGGRRHPGVGCGRLAGNPVHERAAAAAALAPPVVAIEALPTRDGPRFLVGSLAEVHAAGAAWVARARAVAAREPRRLVVASAGGHPRDRDLVQSHKALEHLRAALRPGGSAVLFAACGDGLGHPDLLRYGRLGDAAAVRRALVERFAVYGQTAWALREKARCFDLVLVSRLPAGDVRALGMRPASTAEEALAAVRGVLPEGEPGWIIPDAGGCLATTAA